MNPNEIIEKLNWRYAVKKFDSKKKLTDVQWSTLSEALRLAPSSYGLQPWKFIVVQDPKLRAALRQYSWDQSQVEDCSHFVVFTTRKEMTLGHVEKYMNKIVAVRGVTHDSLKGYKDGIVSDVVDGPRAKIALPWMQRQAYIAMGFLMETAALIGVDACPMEGLSPSEYDKVLGLEGTEFQTIAAVAVGFRAEDDGYQKYKKVRFDTQDVIEFR